MGYYRTNSYVAVGPIELGLQAQTLTAHESRGASFLFPLVAVGPIELGLQAQYFSGPDKFLRGGWTHQIGPEGPVL